MSTYLKYDEIHTVEFQVKPVWKDHWQFSLGHVGADLSLIGQGVVSQRFLLEDNKGKPMTLVCPLITADELEMLHAFANYLDGPLTVKPEDEETTYSVIFRAENPLEIVPIAGEFPDEDKASAGSPYDRYRVTLHLIVV